MKTLIYLDSIETLTASWVVVDDTGRVIQSMLHSHLNELLTDAKNADIRVIVPAEDILITHANLPKLSRHRLLQALPFALEDQLIDDLENLHFAVGNYQPDGSIPVAVIAKEKMASWIEAFKTLELNPTEFIPGMFALPYEENTWRIHIGEKACAVRTGAFYGFCCDKDNLASILEIGLIDAVQKPSRLQIYCIAEEEFGIALTQGITIQQTTLSETDFLTQIALRATEQPVINLLQGVYQPKRKTSESKKIWGYAIYATLTWVLLAFFTNTIAYLILHRQATKLDSAINVIYRKNFPQATAVVAPRDRMESKLNSLVGGAGNNVFLSMLANVGHLLSENTSITLKNMDYRDNQLTLELTASSFDDVDSFVKKIAAKNYTVKEQNAAVNGAEVKASVLIQQGKS